jgi:sugar transferase (PEP-CTERM/EpsH1 system associated)
VAGSSKREIENISPRRAPLIAHVVYRFDVGGLENGVVNLVNRLAHDRFRHVVVSLTDVTDFRRRVLRDDVEFVELQKPPGHGFKLFPRLYRLFRSLRPDIVHTRNLAALEASAPAWCAGARVLIHSEHGHEMHDLAGSNRTYRMVRRAYRPLVDHYVALSRDLERYLVDEIGVPPARVDRIINGVDTNVFMPAQGNAAPDGFPFADPSLCVVGTVGRLRPIKNQTLLAHAFARALEIAPRLRSRLRLAIVGEGPLRSEIADALARASLSRLAWLPGERADIPRLLQAFDIFALPSLGEGISNTILEAMATGLPVVATDVGGNAELIHRDRTGTIVASGDVEAFAHAIVTYADDPMLARNAGREGRARAEQLYSLTTMVASYAGLYERLLRAPRGFAPKVETSAIRGHTH